MEMTDQYTVYMRNLCKLLFSELVFISAALYMIYDEGTVTHAATVSLGPTGLLHVGVMTHKSAEGKV